LKRALVPTPFAVLGPAPASVVTEAVAMTIWRMRLLLVSATKA
jgi:hypothetical protein